MANDDGDRGEADTHSGHGKREAAARMHAPIEECADNGTADGGGRG